MKAAHEIAIRVAIENDVRHFVYLSVAHPAPAMQAYIDARSRCEQTLRESGLNATILRPWYVLVRATAGPMLCCRLIAFEFSKCLRSGISAAPTEVLYAPALRPLGGSPVAC